MKMILKIAFGAAFVIALFLTRPFQELWQGAGIVIVTFGFAASLLMGFSGREIGEGFRAAAGGPASGAGLTRAAYFWEAAARNAWILGVLGSEISFIIALSKESAEIAEVTVRMTQTFVITLYGLILAALCLIPALKIAGRKDGGAQVIRTVTTGKLPVSGRVLGYVLFAAVLAATGYSLAGGAAARGPLPAKSFILPWPSTLVVIGGSAALALFTWPGVGARALTLGFGMTGLISVLAGFIQAMFGFVHHDIRQVGSAIIFIISSGLLALLGMLIAAAPLEDREVMEGRRERMAFSSRMFWIVFPLVTFFFLILSFLAIITPMTKPG
jgi:hypothetical protein